MQVFFHIGYPKAASTSLQKNLFARSPDLVNIGLYPTSNVGNDVSENHPSDNIPYLKDKRIKQLYQALSLPGTLEFDLESTKGLWRQIKSDYLRSDSSALKKGIILSHESITSTRFSNPSLLEKANRVRDVFGPIKIIVIIRRQQDMLRSLYRDHPFDPRTLGGQVRPVDFHRWLEIDLPRASQSLAHSLYFDRLLYLYEEFFGKENILVLPVELMQLNLESFAGALSRFMEIDSKSTYRLINRPPQNTSVSELGNRYRVLKARSASKLAFIKPLKAPLLRFDHYVFGHLKKTGRPPSVKISAQYENLLCQLYATSNRNLSRDYDLSLDLLDYYVE